jgi:hypothetical protein
VTAFRYLEAVVLGEERRFLIAFELLQRGRVLLIVNIREALEEQQREDVGLEVRRIGPASIKRTEKKGVTG